MHSRTSVIIGSIGRTLIFFGLIVLAFAGYQLWGTGIQEDRAQNSLESEFAEQQALVASLGGTTTAVPTPTTTAPAQNDGPSTTVPQTAETLPVVIAPELAEELLPARGEPMGVIRIPSIGVDKVVIEGVGRDDLRKGPGHYNTTPFPGQPGNAAIAGHRTTYGQPFHNLDLVQPGELIEVETLQGSFFYEVMGHDNGEGIDIGHFIVDPGQVEIVEDYGDNRLTLTACHPKYSARQRIVVTAIMVGAPAPLIPNTNTEPDEPMSAEEIALMEAEATGLTTEAALDEGRPADGTANQNNPDEGNVVGVDDDDLDESLGWHFEELQPTLLWSALGLLVMLAGWLLGRAWKKWPAYAMASPVFLIVLFITFGHLDRMLPAL